MSDATFDKALEAYHNRDYAAALDLFQQAFERGNMDAAFYLGQIHDYDTGFYDAAKAYHWHRLAAEDGILRSMFHIAQALIMGKAVPRDMPEALLWLEKCQNHIPDAVIRLAQAHMGEFGPDPALSPAKAFTYSKRVYEAEKNGEYAQILAGSDSHMGAILLGACYERGIGTAPDEEKAIEIYLEHANEGYMSADRLARLYERRGDIASAVKWYRKVDELAPRNEYATVKIMELTEWRK